MATGYKTLSWDAKVDAELAEWPGVSWSRQGGRKHQRLVLVYGSQSRFVVYSASPSDRRGLQNSLTDVRHALRDMGAKRNARAKATVRRSRNKPIRNPLANVSTAPVKGNPWAALEACVPPARTRMQRAASGIVAAWQRLKGFVRSTTSPAPKGDAK